MVNNIICGNFLVDSGRVKIRLCDLWDCAILGWRAALCAKGRVTLVPKVAWPQVHRFAADLHLCTHPSGIKVEFRWPIFYFCRVVIYCQLTFNLYPNWLAVPLAFLGIWDTEKWEIMIPCFPCIQWFCDYLFLVSERNGCKIADSIGELTAKSPTVLAICHWLCDWKFRGEQLERVEI